MTNVRTVKRPRRYVARQWLVLASPLFTYDSSRDAYLLRLVGDRVGPVLREDRRTHREANRHPWSDRSGLLPEGLESSEHAERRRAGLA
jgi:hypothetical protein